MTTNILSSKNQENDQKIHDSALKQLELQEKEFSVNQKLIKEEAREDDKMLIEKIKTIASLLTDSQVDEEKSVFGGETQYRPIFNEQQQEELRALALQLANQLVKASSK